MQNLSSPDMISSQCEISLSSFLPYLQFSDFMQRGASLSSSQLIKLITRGKTSRLSAEPLLEFFRPLEAWLEGQNRDENVSTINLKIIVQKRIYCLHHFSIYFQVIGWSSNMDDVQLFQNLAFNRATENLNLKINKLLTLMCFMLIQKLL